tara:strand:- start:3489 stop:3881 length:393 start_codon:yes stop_codon:yes gene_type:complete
MLPAYLLSFVLILAMIGALCGARPLVEGLTSNPAQNPYQGEFTDKKYNEPPLGQNPVYLAALNAANIDFLNNKLKDYQKTKDELEKVQKGEEQNATALAKIAKELQSAMGKNAPSKPATLPAKYRKQLSQ